MVTLDLENSPTVIPSSITFKVVKKLRAICLFVLWPVQFLRQILYFFRLKSLRAQETPEMIENRIWMKLFRTRRAADKSSFSTRVFSKWNLHGFSFFSLFSHRDKGSFYCDWTFYQLLFNWKCIENLYFFFKQHRCFMASLIRFSFISLLFLYFAFC